MLQFKDDERKGFRLLYDSFYDSLVLFATQFIGEAEEAADIVQECDELYDEVSGENSELIEKLYLAIEMLPEERRRILHMVCMEGMKYQEVADCLGISINTVKTQMGRAFQFLRRALGADDALILVLFFKKIVSCCHPK